VVHIEGGGTRLLKKSQWPTLCLNDSVEDASDIPLLEPTSQEASGMGEVVELDNTKNWEEVVHTEGDEMEDAWEVILSKKKISKKKFMPVVATRKSVRVAGLPTRTTTTRSSGLSTPPPSNSNSFLVLNSCNDDLLEEIAYKCEVRLGTLPGESQQSIFAMKLEE